MCVCIYIYIGSGLACWLLVNYKPSDISGGASATNKTSFTSGNKFYKKSVFSMKNQQHLLGMYFYDLVHVCIVKHKENKSDKYDDIMQVKKETLTDRNGQKTRKDTI